jgi:uncharacterized membrane protein YsdA (DUF1294 family)
MSTSNNQPSAPDDQPKTFKVLEIDRARAEQFRRQMRDEQNWSRAVLGGLTAAVFGAILWALVTALSGYKTAVMALGVGACVGFVVRKQGKGVEDKFGLLAGTLALSGCLAGNVLALAAIVARDQGVSLLGVLLAFLARPQGVVLLLMATYSPLDLLFYGLALYEAYVLAFRKITAAERESFYRERPRTL